MDKEKIEKILKDHQEALEARIPLASKRGPETLLDELAAYEPMFDLRKN